MTKGTQKGRKERLREGKGRGGWKSRRLKKTKWK